MPDEPNLPSSPTRMATSAVSSLSVEELEEVSKSIGNVLDAINRLAHEVANGTMDDGTRKAIAKQLRSVLGETSTLYLGLASNVDGAELLASRVRRVVADLDEP